MSPSAPTPGALGAPSQPLDEYPREGLALRVGHRLTRAAVPAGLTDLFCTRGVPQPLRADNGAEFAWAQVRPWLQELGTQPLFIEPGRPWENGDIESVKGNFREAVLNRESFYSLPEAPGIIEPWRQAYHTVRPPSVLGYRPPAPAASLAPAIAQPLWAVETSMTT